MRKEFDIRNDTPRAVICADNHDHTWGFNDRASQYLIVGETYHVIGVDVHSWHTRVTVSEFPNQQFNSASFEEAHDE